MQDIFDWAGQTRTFDIVKNVEGTTHFLPASMIERSAGFIAQELASERMLGRLPQDQLVDGSPTITKPLLARVQRRKWKNPALRLGQVAHEATYDLNWIDVTGKVNRA